MSDECTACENEKTVYGASYRTMLLVHANDWPTEAPVIRAEGIEDGSFVRFGCPWCTGSLSHEVIDGMVLRIDAPLFGEVS